MGSLKKIIHLNTIGWILYLVITIICFLFFLQADIIHTATSSYAYLNGHIQDFYDYNKVYMGGNDYLPLMYIIFAIWNIPIHFLGFTTTPELNHFQWNLLTQPSLPIELAWWKTLLAVFYIGSIMMMAKITKLIQTDTKFELSLISTVFATSPFVIFAVFIFSGYDIFSTFFTLLGFYYYLKKDLRLFILFFAVAISLKYFAAILFFPLVLMIEKRPLHILKILILSVSIILIQVILYWKSQIFKDEILSLLLQKLIPNSGNEINFSKLTPKLFLLMFYLSACIHVFFKEFKSNTERHKYAVFIPILSYALLFLAVKWHPQWCIIIMPFIMLSYIFIQNKRLLSTLEIIGMISFIWYVFNAWKLNVDVSMMNNSVLKNLLPQALIINSDLFHGGKSLFRFIFNLYLFSPLLLVFYEAKKTSQIKATILSQKMIINRLLIGIGFLVISSFVCIFMPENLGKFINPNATIRLHDKLIGN